MKSQKIRFTIFLTLLVLLVPPVLTIKIAPTVQATFSGNNGLIAFGSERDGNWEIYVMKPDGSEQTRLTNNVARDDFPAWSPEGTKIAFASYRDGNYEIYVMNANGTDQTRLTINNAIDECPAWFPDGTKIAFSSNRDGNYEIYVMNDDGSFQTRLTNNTAYDRFPNWSPDGTKIAFSSYRDGNYEIYVMNANGTDQTRVTNNIYHDYCPNWSPDGTKIVFQSRIDGNDKVCIMNNDGTNLTELTNGATDYDPAWSPDGTKIIYSSDRDGNTEIYIMNFDGTNQTRLTDNIQPDDWPDWQPISLSVKQNATLSIEASALALTVGSNLTVFGALAPSRSGTISILQSINGSAFTLLNIATLAGGAYYFTFSPSTTGSYQFYATWPGDSLYNPAQSSIVTVSSAQAAPPIDSLWYVVIAGVVILAIALTVYFLRRK